MKAVIVENPSSPELAAHMLEGSTMDIIVDKCFHEELDILKYVVKNGISLVLLDVPFMGIRALQLGEQLRRRLPDIMILYIADTANYMAVLEAVRMHIGAYVMRPFSIKDLEYAIDTARLLLKKKEKRIFARTFGNFELFVDERPVKFKSSKAKELLALLVDRRGGIVTSEQAIGTLWEYRANDEASRSLYSKVGKSLTIALEDVGAEELVITSWGMKSIDTDQLDCDLYQFLDGDEKAKMNYFGRYMMDYSWAEYRVPGLDRLSHLEKER